MVRNSLKQLARSRGKTILFFLLMAASTLLLVFGGVTLFDANARIAEVEEQFTTIGMIEQDPVRTSVPVYTANECQTHQLIGWRDISDNLIPVERLNFEGAKYLSPPEFRPYYAAYLPQFEQNPAPSIDYHDYAVFTALEDCTQAGQPVEVRIEKLLHTAGDGVSREYFLDPRSLKEGENCFCCYCLLAENNSALPLTAGKQYVGALYAFDCETHGITENLFRTGPYSDQYDPDGSLRESGYFPKTETGERIRFYAEEVTEGFWEKGGRGEKWLQMLDYYLNTSHQLFYVVPTNDLQLLPAFQKQQAYVSEGREITAEEFQKGSRVCMVTKNLLELNGLKIGDKLTLPLLMACYGYTEDDVASLAFDRVSPFNAEGELYEPFWEEEYEIVGAFEVIPGNATSDGKFPRQAFVIPSKSVEASDAENIVSFEAMNRNVASFRIPNGTIEEFHASLLKHVPEAEELTITYNDNGYTELMRDLKAMRLTAILLFVFGSLAAVVVTILCLYFFVVRQKKRTAIERGLGLSKAGCRVSLLSGVLSLMLLASLLGSAGAFAAFQVSGQPAGQPETEITASAAEPENSLSEAEPASQEDDPAEEAEKPQETGLTEFSTKYSLWTAEEETKSFPEQQVPTPLALYLVPPAALWLFALLLSLFLVNRSLKADPMELLGQKTEA